MEPLSPLVAIAGGLLIGTAAALLLLLNGRIAGVSGMLATTTSRIGAGGPPWRQAAAFIAGLPLGAVLIATFVRKPDLVIAVSPAALVLAGLLVGFGTRLGNGCTSGHGVCGMARLSPRSILATLTFMATAALTVFVLRHLLEI